MLTRICKIIPSVLLVVTGFMAAPALSQMQENEDITRLDIDNPEAFAFFEAVGIYDFLQIVSEESIAGADQVRQEFFPDLAPEIWESEMRDLFAVDVLVTGFEAAWQDDALSPEARAVVLEFYTSDLGLRVVEAEIAARAGMADPGISEAARSAVMMAERDDDERLEAFAEFSAELGLVDRNVTSMMNAQLQFLTALTDEGALQPPMPEEDLLRFIAAQAGEIRVEAEEWMQAYHLMAYGGLTPEEFARFLEVNASPEGRALASAIFAAFDATFDTLQYQLGVAAAHHAAGDDI